MYKSIGLRAVCRAHFGLIPFDPRSGTECDIAEQKRFREARRIAEIRECLCASATCIHPLLVVADGSRQRWRWTLVVEILFARQQNEHVALILAAMPGPRKQRALRA